MNILVITNGNSTDMKVHFLKEHINYWREKGNFVEVFYMQKGLEFDSEVDLIWCEWADTNAIEVSNNMLNIMSRLQKRIPLIVHLHHYETEKFIDFEGRMLPVACFINWNRVARLVVPCEYTKKRFEEVVGAGLVETEIIGTPIDFDKFYYTEKDYNKIGNLSINHSNKGIRGVFDLFLELEENFELHIKGDKFSDDELFNRLNSDNTLFKGELRKYIDYIINSNNISNRVNIDKLVNITDIEREKKLSEWAKDIGFIICNSIEESQGVGLMEMVAGCHCIPIIRKNISFDSIIPKEYLNEFGFNTITEAKEMIYEFKECMERKDGLFEGYLSEFIEWIKSTYSIENQCNKSMELINNVMKEEAHWTEKDVSIDEYIGTAIREIRNGFEKLKRARIIKD